MIKSMVYVSEDSKLTVWIDRTTRARTTQWQVTCQADGEGFVYRRRVDKFTTAQGIAREFVEGYKGQPK